ncbi:MAG TPA: hypothetical protein PKI11_21535 [Candidatus Hydrogenedentes bacterium]|nr:hypothetical protein [Candidatus Hydrogenedentota bacterium]
MSEVTNISLHSFRDAARAMHVSIATVEAMVEAGQLLTVLPAGAKYPRVTGASMLAFAGRVPDEPPSIPQMDVRGLLERKRGPSEAALAPLFSGDWS